MLIISSTALDVVLLLTFQVYPVRSISIKMYLFYGTNQRKFSRFQMVLPCDVYVDCRREEIQDFSRNEQYGYYACTCSVQRFADGLQHLTCSAIKKCVFSCVDILLSEEQVSFAFGPTYALKDRVCPAASSALKPTTRCVHSCWTI